MKIKALLDCNGIGYENLKAGEVRDISKEIATVLISFGYAEEAKKTKGDG